MICEPCQKSINRWREWQAPYRGWLVVAYSTERNRQQSVEQYSARADERRELIRSQIAAIKQTCAEKHQEVVT